MARAAREHQCRGRARPRAAPGPGPGLGCGGILVVGSSPSSPARIRWRCSRSASRCRGLPSSRSTSASRAARRRTSSASSPRWCSPTPRTSGARSSPRRRDGYRPPKLVLFSRRWCSRPAATQRRGRTLLLPAGRSKVYLDLSFFDELARRFGAPGDFAAGLRRRARGRPPRPEPARLSDRVTRRSRTRASQEEANELSVPSRAEADCFAGVWAYHAHREQQLLEPGDVEEGLRAAAAIGDDRLQKMATGRVRPTASRTAPRSSACSG